MTDVIWTVSRDDIAGAERCTLRQQDDGWLLAGVVVARFEGRTVDARYEVAVDADWVTRAVDVTFDTLGQDLALRLERAVDASWTIDGDPAPHLDGCDDVDLGITPSTNTLPIRRLGLEVGQERDIEVAWVRFPELRVDRGTQTYTRLEDHRWRYRSGTFTAELVVDADDLVVRYGDDLWRQAAS